MLGHEVGALVNGTGALVKVISLTELPGLLAI